MIDDLYVQARLRDLSRDIARIAAERRALALTRTDAAHPTARPGSTAQPACETADSWALA